jgi:hypothetical protein
LRPKLIDARYRWAAGIYAAGLTQALAAPTEDAGPEGRHPIPALQARGHQFDAHETEYGRSHADRLRAHRAVRDLRIEQSRYRQPGIRRALAPGRS